MKKVLFIIAQKNFRDEELFHTQEELRRFHIETQIASEEKKEAVGSLGGTVMPDYDLANVHPEDFDAVSIIGGPGALTLGRNRTFLKKRTGL